MKCDRQKFCDAPDKIKLDIVQNELRLVTHNGTTKDDLLMLLDWCYNRLIKGDLKAKQEESKPIEIDIFNRTELHTVKTNFDVITESPERLVEYFYDVVKLYSDKLGLSMPQTKVAAIEEFKGWLNQKAEEE